MKVATYSGVEKNNKIWFSNVRANGLYSFDPFNGNLEFVSLFPDEDFSKEYMHKYALVYDSTLIFIPLQSNKIYFYNLVDKVFSMISLPGECEDRFSGAYVIGNRLWLFPMYKNGNLIIIDLHTFAIEQDSTFFEGCLRYVKEDSGILIAKTQFVEGKILFALYGTNVFGYYDTNTRSFEFTETDIKDIYSVTLMNGSIWILSNNTTDLFCYNDNKDLDKYETGLKMPDVPRYYNIVEAQNEMTYFFPAFSTKIIQLDNMQTKEIYDFAINKLLDPKCTRASVISTVKINGSIFVLPIQYDAFLVLENGCIKQIDIEENTEFEKAVILQNGGLVEETSIVSLKEYIYCI